jgi:hypothetical protein
LSCLPLVSYRPREFQEELVVSRTGAPLPNKPYANGRVEVLAPHHPSQFLGALRHITPVAKSRWTRTPRT